MALFFNYAGTDLGTTTVRLGAITGGLQSRAESGTLGTGGIPLDDPTGSLTIAGLQPFYVQESLCTSAPRLWTGYLMDRTISRGQGGATDSLNTGAARIYDCNLVDLNAIPQFQVFTAVAANRPAETVTARIAWLMASTQMSLVHDHGYIGTSANVLSPSDYRGNYPQDVLNDIRAVTGWDSYVFFEQTYAQPTLFLNDPTAATRVSTLSISNLRTDTSSTCFFPLIDAKLVRDPSRVYSGVYLEWLGGATYVTNATTASNFVARDVVSSTSRIGRSATATAVANQFLQSSSTEFDRISLTIKVPASQVNLIDAGMRVNAKFTHLPGYTSGENLRVALRSVLANEETDQFYNVYLELVTPIQTSYSPFGNGKVPDLGPPAQPPTGGTPPDCGITDAFNRPDVAVGTNAMGTADCGYPWTGSEQGISSDRGFMYDPSDSFFNTAYLTGSVPFPVTGQIDITGTSDTTHLLEDAKITLTCNGGGITAVFQYNVDTPFLEVTLSDGTNTASASTTLAGVFAFPFTFQFAITSTTITATIGAVAVSVSIASATPSAIATLTSAKDFTLFFDGYEGGYIYFDNLNIAGLNQCTGTPPALGPGTNVATQVGTGDGTTVLFTTPTGYVPGSLQVFVNGALASNVTETSPSAGTFTLAVAPASSAVVSANWTVVTVPGTEWSTAFGARPASGAVSYSNLSGTTISNLGFSGTTGPAITLTNCSDVTVTMCDFDTCIGGVFAINCTNITVTWCRYSEIGDNSIGSGHSNFVQFNNVTGGYIGNNKGKGGLTEDIVSMFVSQGNSVADPIIIENNAFEGTDWTSHSGSAFQLGDGGGAYILCRNNVVLNPGQTAIGVPSGTNIIVTGNTIYGAEMTASNVGISVWNQYPSFCGSITISDNRVKWFNASGSENPYWNAGNCGAVIGESTNDWHANLDPANLGVTL